ncbi:MAG TPA: inositol monophosphatase [Bellilinea sp.]|nr:inositol monophosphatase [Bellilinea sp.]
MSLISLSTINEIQQLLRQAGEKAMARRSTANVQFKPDRTPFTDVELAMEAEILPFLREEFPDYQILSEENGTQGPVKTSSWALDPIDGTKIYLLGLPTWGISLGSIVDGQPGVGFFYMPVTGDMYWGGAGYGAFHNDQRLPAVMNQDLTNPLTFIAIPANGPRYFDIDYANLRSLGSTAAHCCYVAQGAAVGALLRRVNLWDLAGVLPILAQTGVKVEFYSGGPFLPEPYLTGAKIKEEILVARPPIINQLRGLILRKTKDQYS